MTPPDPSPAAPDLAQAAPSGPPQAELFVRSVPDFAWGFEPADFTVELKNLALDELTRPPTAAQANARIDLHRADGSFFRTLARRPVPEAVPIGETRRFETAIDVRAFAGDYELRLGLESGNGTREPVAVTTAPAPVRVKNTIFEAFLELINACNFRCTFCPQTTLQRKQRPMDFELATKLIRDLADMGHHHPVRVHLLGEPLLYPRFFDFVEMAHHHGQRVLLATNGSRFSEKNVEGIFRTGLDEMVISLNTPEEELYNQQRGTRVPYSEYIEGVERMVSEVVRRGAPPKTRVNVLYPGDRGGDSVELERVRRICNDWIDVVRRVSGRDLPPAEEVVHLDRDRTTLVDLCEGLELQWTAYHNWGEGEPPQAHFCSFPWRQLAVLVDGQATTCCVDAEGEITLGNAKERSLEEIWNGPELERLRAGFQLQTAVEPRCMRCDVRHDMAEFFPDAARG